VANRAELAADVVVSIRAWRLGSTSQAHRIAGSRAIESFRPQSANSLLSLFPCCPLTIFLSCRDRRSGEPAGQAGASPDDIDNIRRQLGLDEPTLGAVRAIRPRASLTATSPSPLLPHAGARLYFQRLPNSLLLRAVAMALSLLIGHPERHPRCGAGSMASGTRGQDLCAAGLSLHPSGSDW